MLVSKQISIILIIILFNLMLIFACEIKNPCDNFYEFACSNYSLENPDTNYSEITQKLDYEMNKKLIRILNLLTQRTSVELHRQNTECDYNDKMLSYWQSCIRETQRNLSKYFDEIKPGTLLNWPLLDKKMPWLGRNETMNIWSLLGEMQSYGLNNIIVTQEITRNKDNTLNIWLKPATLNKEHLLPENNVLKILLGNLNLQNSEIIIQHLHKTELKWLAIINKYAASHQVIEVGYNDLPLVYPHLKLTSYLEKLLPNRDLDFINLIAIEDPKYFEFLNEKLWSKKELKHLTNYLMIKFLYYLAKDSTNGFSSSQCVKDLRNKFDVAVNTLYYQYYFNFEPKTFHLYFNRLIYKIRKTMGKYFSNNFLQLSREQVNFLQTKLKAVKVNIGNLPKGFTNQTIQEFYQELPPLDKENYYKNHMLLLKHRFRKSLLYIHNQTHFVVTDNQYGSVISPFYVAQQNIIVIPFGSFQMPLFQYLKSPLEQLAIFGFVFAHELTHAFDTDGLLYDQQGFPLAAPSDILTNNNFLNSLNCMQNQEPTDDINERLADFFALHVTYRTYVDYYAKEEEENYWQAYFFVNLAQFFCGKGDLEFIDHDADPIRLQQIVKNFQPFVEAFGCTENNLMFTANKCRLY